MSHALCKMDKNIYLQDAESDVHISPALSFLLIAEYNLFEVTYTLL